MRSALLLSFGLLAVACRHPAPGSAAAPRGDAAVTGADGGSASMKRSSVGEIASRFAAMPAWSDVPRGDRAALRRVEDAARALVRCDVESLRAAEEQYVAERRAAGHYDVSAMSRLYVLHRLLFQVPARVAVGAPRFASFAGVPVDGGTLDERWPWSEAAGGGLSLTGEFKGYFGEDYLALQEFDQFRRAYGLRPVEAGAK